MCKIILFEVFFLFLFVVESFTMPPMSGHCPVPTTDEEFGTSKVLNLNNIRGHKVRVQFFYPSEQSALRALENSTETTRSGEDGCGSGGGSSSDCVNGTNPSAGGDEAAEALSKQNVFCQWTFKAGDESEFLLLSFERLSAPYSENCQEAFVALQKDGGYESRWCGNRDRAQQPNARPMTILVRSDAIVTVFRSKTAALLPPTGFKLSVKKLDVGSITPQLPSSKKSETESG